MLQLLLYHFTAVFYPGTFWGGEVSPQTSKLPLPRIFGHACREAKNNVNTRLTSFTKCLMSRTLGPLSLSV